MTFSIRATHHGRHTWLTQGDKLSVEFPDGKGVEARIADVSIAPGGTPFSIICTPGGEWPDAQPEFAPGEAKDTDGSDDLTEGEGDLLSALRAKSRQAEKLKRQVEELTNELEFRTRREAEKDRIIGTRTRQLERSRRHHDEKNDQLAGLEKALERRHRDVEELRASLRDLGNDYRIVQEQLEQEKARSLDLSTRIIDAAKRAEAKAGAIDRLSGSTINFYGSLARAQQVVAARERPRQRVVTQHDGDGSVTIRVELREGN